MSNKKKTAKKIEPKALAAKVRSSSARPEKGSRGGNSLNKTLALGRSKEIARSDGDRLNIKYFVVGLMMLGLVYQCLGIIRIKAHQHIRVIPLAPLANQGEANGNVSAVVDIKGGPGGSVLTLSHLSVGYFIQRFNPDFVFELGRLFKPKEKPAFKDLAAMAVLDDGHVLLAERNGPVYRLDANFKPDAVIKLNLNEIKSMGISAAGKLLVLEPLQRKVLVFDMDGTFLTGFGDDLLVSPKAMAVTGKGRIVILDQADEAHYILRVFDPEGKFERSLSVDNVPPSPPDTLGAGGKELVALNDAGGSRGVLFYDVAQGKFYGECMGAEQSASPMVAPGFAAGDPKTGVFYLHFGPGLLKCRVPGN